ncbi:MAG TPA: VOC family protein [Acidimicrobiia bacterium]|nr:VOC family protein [Acidimicrobiia bacterium]
MAFHHLALATTDLAATHRFYTEAMGFELVMVEGAATEVEGGWLRHVLYDTGDGTLLAIAELHDDRCRDFDPAISRGLGLPSWVNHIAFAVDDLDALDGARDRWLRTGHDVVRMEHTLGPSIYTEDPNGNTIEWACSIQPITDHHRMEAGRRLAGEIPLGAPTDMEFFEASAHV